MKILITSEWYSPIINGVITSIRNLEHELSKLGHEVRILTLSRNIHSHRQGHVTAIASLSAGWVYPNARFTHISDNKLIKALVEWKPDIIHSQAEFSSFRMAKQIAKQTRAPIIHTYHTVYADYTRHVFPAKRMGKRLSIVFSRTILEQTDRIIAPTEKVRQILLGYQIKTPIEVVATGIDLAHFSVAKDCERLKALKIRLHLAESQTVLIYLGRIAKEKNIEELLSYVKELGDPALVLLIVGDGPHLKNLKEYAATLGIESQLRFCGMIKPSEVPDYYALANLFVSASQCETQGLTYIEALASGLPALCKKDACLEGVIADEQNGWQYTAQADFLSHLKRFMADAKLRQQLSRNARRHALKEFSAQNFAAQIVRQYELSLLEKRTSAYA